MRNWIIACCLSPLALFAAEWNFNDMPTGLIRQGWGSAMLNRSVDNRELSVGGVKFHHGIGTHAPGGFSLILDGRATRLSGAVGIDDEVGRAGEASLRIYGSRSDGQELLLWESGAFRGGETAKTFSIPLRDITRLRIDLSDNGNMNYDHVDLLDWRIEYDRNAPEMQLPPEVITTKNIRWFFRMEPGKPLMQNGFGFNAASAPAQQAILPYPLRGATGFRLDENLRIIQADGAHTVELVCDRLESRTRGEGILETRFFLVDRNYPVRAEYVVTAFWKEDVILAHLEIVNEGKEPVTLLNRDSAFVALDLEKDAWLTSFTGDWAREFTGVHEEKVVSGITKHQHRGAIRTAWPEWPGFYLSLNGKATEETGVVFAAALAWSGSWQYKISMLPAVTPHAKPELFISAGVQEDPVRLNAGSRYVTPELVMTASREGRGRASRNFHAYLKRDGIRNPDAVRRIVLNSWEGVYFNFNEDKIISMMDGAADLGVELFVLDDGWFGNGKFQRNSDNAGLGDWQENTAKLPNGLKHLIDEAEARGLEFGLWVEPEMVNPASRLFETHPEWAMQIPNRERIPARNQYVLDLSRPEVESFVYETVAGILKKHPRIRYIKWDHNCVGLNLGSAALKHNQGALSDLHTQAYYRIMAKLRRNFPAVTFQLCASGGGRVDYGSMRYNEEFWASDETNAIKRIPIQWGFSHFFPSCAIASHIGRYGEGDFKLRADVAMTGRLGVELSPDAITPEQRDIVRKGIAAYKNIRPILHASELYRGRSPHDSMLTELTFVMPDKSEAVFFAFLRKNSEKTITRTLKVSGLDPDAIYRYTEVNPEDSVPRCSAAAASGRELMETGIEFTFPARPSSAVVHLKKIH